MSTGTGQLHRDDDPKMNISLLLKLLAPYLAVGLFWCVLSNGWLAILAYHAQILLWSRRNPIKWHGPTQRRMLLLAAPTLVAGPVLYFLLPHITAMELSEWMRAYGLTGIALVIMIPYFGLLHPIIEQIHWSPLRDQTPLAHVCFAGYHVLVLSSLLTPVWTVLCFVLLVAASVLWQYLQKQTRSLWVPIASHVLADLSMILVAAWLCLQG